VTPGVDTGALTRRLTGRFGPGVADWCAGIPALARALAGRWGLSPGEPFPAGNSSVAIRCTRSDGGAARRLVAIDPRACVGDPCFDAVDYLLDGAGRDGADGIGARCAALAAASGLDAGRLHDWCRAVAPIVAITYLRRPGSPRRPGWQEAVTELLALAR
jgi:hypothetical protein